jgi:hypothetical protein
MIYRGFVLGLNNNDLSICREWMKPFYEVLLQSSSTNSSIRSSPSIPIDEVYSIQIHNISIDLLVKIQLKYFHCDLI